MLPFEIYKAASEDLKTKILRIDSKCPLFTKTIRDAIAAHNKAQQDRQLQMRFINVTSGLLKARSDNEVQQVLKVM